MSIKTLSAILLGVGSFAWAVTSVPALEIEDGATLLIDDFSDDTETNLKSELGYSWKADSDKNSDAGQGASEIALSFTENNTIEGDENSFRAIKMDFTFDKGDYPYDAYVNLSAFIAGEGADKQLLARDVSRCSEVRYYYRGDAHTFNLYDADAEDIGYAFHYADLGKSLTWTSAKIVLKNLEQPYWAKDGINERDIEESIQKAAMFMWQVNGEDGASGSLEIANVRCVNVPPPPLFKIADGAEVVIDDFASKNLKKNSLGYEWESDVNTDGSGTSINSFTITENNEYKGKTFNALKLDAKFGFGEDYDPQVDIYTYVSPKIDGEYTPVDMSRCTEVRYDYRGKDHAFLIRDYDGEEIGHNYHKIEVEGSDEWSSATITLKELEQDEYYGKYRDIETSIQNVSMFGWRMEDFEKSGTLEIANVRCVNIAPPPAIAYINQVGYRPGEIKMFTISSTSGDAIETVEILDADDKVVLTVTPSKASTWNAAGMDVQQVDFTELDKAGTYKIKVGDVVLRDDLKILEKTYEEVVKASLKWYYYQRASIELTEEYAGEWARAAGHTNETVIFHGSTGEEGTTQSSKGWYDAGDYGRYTVNSGISTYTLLALYEHYPEYFKTLKWNIPAEGKLPDLLAEIKWNLDWMLTMQAKDGGVYHKLSSLKFAGTVMPGNDKSQQYVIGKSTAGTFDFAAVMAVAARVYKAFDEEFAAKCLTAAKAAYAWGLKNPAENFTKNPLGVETGEYQDNDPSDEKLFAGTELYLTTKDESYNVKGTMALVPYWGGMAGIATYDKATHATAFGTEGATAKAAILELADKFVKRTETGFGVVMDEIDFVWGSNAVAANQGVWLLHAYYITGEKKYYEAAVKVVDYLLGKNPNDMSFVTGTGTTSPMNPHHRPSQADGVNDPVPGMLVGGPQPGFEDYGSCDDYTTGYPATTYNDNTCSYATNEVAINWNAPLAYLVGAIEALNAGETPSFLAKIKYEITFLNADGTELQSSEVKEGETPVYEGDNPTKAATAQYTYTFKAWDKELAKVTEAATYTAVFDSIVNQYQIKFVVGGKADSAKYDYGTKVADIKVPETKKTATAQYTYTFKAWDKELAEVKEAATYTALFDSTVNKYLVLFVVDGKVDSAKYTYGTKADSLKAPTATRKATDKYTYTFKGWDKKVADVTEAATYTALFDSTVNKYLIKFVVNGKADSAMYAYGTKADSLKKPATTKADTKDSTYTFDGWDKKITDVTGAATYTAKFKAKAKKTEAIVAAARGNFKFGFANNKLTVMQSGASVVRVQLFDMTGNMLENISEYVVGSKDFDLSGLTQGNYVVRVSSKYGQKTTRIAIK